MSQLREWIATLSPELRARLEKGPNGPAAQPVPDIPRRDGTDPPPLSFGQQRLWFLEQMEPGTPTYNMARAMRLRGRLDCAALRRSLDDIVARHETLRTSFTAVDGSPAQLIAPSLSLPLPIADLTGFPEGEREAEASGQAVEEAHRPFDLTRAPLLRARLLRLGDEDHVLVIVLHHIVADEWSLGVLFRELGALYDAHRAGTPATMSGLPIQYADYAAWQRQWLQGERLERELSYWRERLRGAPPVSELPPDHPRSPVQTFRGAKVDVGLPPALSQGLRAVARSERATLFMTLLAACKALLARYAGQEDIVVGSPIAGRARTETEELIGFFVNTLALRTDLSGDPTFRQLLGRVRETAFGAFGHQDLPFERLVEELQPERSLSHSALFQVMFTMQNTSAPAPRLAGLEVEPVPVDRGAARFDLVLYLREEPGGLQLTAEYNTDLFEPDTIARFLGHFRTLLESIVADPDRRLSQLALLTDAERDQALVEWNATGAELPRETVHGWFEAQARRTPDAIAVSSEDEGLSYRELDRRADRLAGVLRARGVGPEVAVGLCLRRSPDLLVGVLGILKAGGAYLPLDPTYPAERLEFMLADAAVPVLVTQRELLHTVPSGVRAVICLDGEGEWMASEDEEPAGAGVVAEQLAYVIYTSGSTGRPKGVQITHRSVANVFHSLRMVPGLGPEDTVLAVSPLTFDIATLELLLPLVVGARVEIAPGDAARDGRLLSAALRRSGATVMQATPTTWRLLVESGWNGAPGLKVLSGGEALSAGLAEDLLARGAEPWNLYGPTETTIYSAAAPVRTRVPPALANSIANTRLYLLDRHLALVPIGVPGELYIGGAGLARGYLGRPGLTADLFLPDPFTEVAGARMYRTGDLMRRLPDGRLEFLGRTDHQVKLRGFRIELGEVEAAIARHPAVREVAVLAREDSPGDKRLVAYVVPVDNRALDAGELRGALQRQLPDYMVPAAFRFLDRLPATPAGKLDRAALPAPDHQPSEMESGYVAPRSPVEQVLAEIWAEVLGRDSVGVHDDFFLLGGHSLLATRVVARMARVLGVEVSLRVFFEAPTVASMTQHLVAMEQAGELGE